MEWRPRGQEAREAGRGLTPEASLEKMRTQTARCSWEQRRGTERETFGDGPLGPGGDAGEDTQGAGLETHWAMELPAGGRAFVRWRTST